MPSSASYGTDHQRTTRPLAEQNKSKPHLRLNRRPWQHLGTRGPYTRSVNESEKKVWPREMGRA